MHSSRMRTARSVTVSHRILCTPGNHTCPPTTMHTPQQPCTPHSNHACPPATMHTPLQLHMPHPCNHACPHNHACSPGNHTCPPASMHPPQIMHAPQPHTPQQPSMPPHGQNDTRVKILPCPNFICGR